MELITLYIDNCRATWDTLILLMKNSKNKEYVINRYITQQAAKDMCKFGCAADRENAERITEEVKTLTDSDWNGIYKYYIAVSKDQE